MHYVGQELDSQRESIRLLTLRLTAAELRIVESVLDRIEYMEVKVSRFLYKTCFVFILF
jgi:hypothetical protein